MADVSHIVAMLADDTLGQAREQYAKPLPQTYLDTFAIIDTDPHAYLLVAEFEGQVIGVAQLNYLAYLTYQGGIRAQIEGVRIHKDYRSHGIGQLLFKDMTKRAKQQGCHMVQLTSNKARPDALRFYEKLGFIASHEGMKLDLINIDTV